MRNFKVEVCVICRHILPLEPNSIIVLLFICICKPFPYSHLHSSTNRKRFDALFTFQNMTFTVVNGSYSDAKIC